jgi:hypothetical protein
MTWHGLPPRCPRGPTVQIVGEIARRCADHDRGAGQLCPPYPDRIGFTESIR